MSGKSVVSSTTEQLLTQLNELVKQHIVYDSAKRPKYIFTAPIHAKDGEPCTVTEYVYLEDNTSLVVNRQERDYRWKKIWETAKPFEFDTNADYDSDGDGEL